MNKIDYIEYIRNYRHDVRLIATSKKELVGYVRTSMPSRAMPTRN